MQNQQSPKLIYLLTKADRQVQQWIKQQGDRSLPSPTQAGVLFLLSKKDGVLMGEISTQLQLVPSAVSGLIQRMESADLIQRVACISDARATRIYLTEKSRELLPQLIQHTHALNQQLLEDFKPEEIEIVERWLTHISQKFHDPK